MSPSFATDRPLRIAILGNHLPRRCGIATFTSHLAESLNRDGSGVTAEVFAMDDGSTATYRPPVVGTIRQANRAEYAATAATINVGKYDLLCVQHEFGIFGGGSGEFLLDLLRNINLPIVCTLHTVLADPSAEQRRVFSEMAQLAQRLVVMTEKGRELVESVYGIPQERIDVIPHGILALDQGDRASSLRSDTGIGSRPLLLTFGLLGSDKGIHNMIAALPAVKELHPDILYAVVGATHPNLVMNEGESYRQKLEAQVRDLGLEENLWWENRFVSDAELTAWLTAADIYVTPYLKEDQITSGTLAFAVGLGCPVVSTPYWHAAELVPKVNGKLVPFGCARGLSEAINGFLSDEDARQGATRAGRAYGASHEWPAVGKTYIETFINAIKESAQLLTILMPFLRDPLPSDPQILRHIINMTDDTGLFQHARFKTPRRSEGYCVDDNARALLVAARPTYAHALQRWRNTYLSFLEDAWCEETKRFRNFLSYDRRWLDDGRKSDDAHARSIHALAVASLAFEPSQGGKIARQLAEEALPTVLDLTSPRAWAWGVLAGRTLAGTSQGDIFSLVEELCGNLMRLMNATQGQNWTWPENYLTYDNARIPEALMVGGRYLRNSSIYLKGLEALEWLVQAQTDERKMFSPVGSNGFWMRGCEKAKFDQQPLEAWATTAACVTAARLTRDVRWIDEARRAFTWFEGANSLGLQLADQSDGSCYDGLHQDRCNENCGAESTISYLLAFDEVRSVANVKTRSSKSFFFDL